MNADYVNCWSISRDFDRERDIQCSGDYGHRGDHYYTGAGGKNICYWGADLVIRWVNR